LLVSASPDEYRAILEYWHQRFGVSPDALRGLRFLIHGKTVWASADLDGLDKILGALKIEAAGLPLLRQRRRGWKPTTAALLFLGNAVTTNVVELSAEDFGPFLSGAVLQGMFTAEGGYVAVRYDGQMLGCGLLGKAGLKSQLPRPWVDALLGGKAPREEEG
jgi:NOL1/NOP2/fmu family ribosome biogenesis protein